MRKLTREVLEGDWSRCYAGDAFPLLLEEREEEEVAATAKATVDFVMT